MWQNKEWNELSDRDKENFARVTNRLLSESFILRQQYDSREGLFRVNRDYRFIEHHKEMIEKYLSFSGWVLHVDDAFGVVHLTNEYEFNRVRLNKKVTYLLYTLRLIYEEEQERVSSRSNLSVSTTTGEIHQKLRSLGIMENKLSKHDLEDSLTFIRSFNIIDKLDDDWLNFDCRIIIYPTIIFIVPNERINALTHKPEEVEIEEEENLEDIQETVTD